MAINLRYHPHNFLVKNNIIIFVNTFLNFIVLLTPLVEINYVVDKASVLK